MRRPEEIPMDIPRSTLETQLGEIWISILKVDKIDSDDDFFDIGATSLHVILFIQQLQKVLGKSVGAEVLLDGATIRQVANKLRNLGHSNNDA